MTRDVAPRLGQYKCALIHSKFFPALQGAKSKMSASDANSAIYMTDTPKQIKKKVMKHAFSGGQDSAEEQRRLGANLEVDVPWMWLQYWLDDDDELARIGADYAAGRMLTGEVKQTLIDTLVPIVERHQRNRAVVTDAALAEFMAVRQLEF